MIHEEICTYEVSKLAKEKGFPQRGIDSNKYWFENFNGIIEEVKDNVFLYEIYPEPRLARQTTQSLLQRWLREEKGIIVIPYYRSVLRRWSATYELTSPCTFEDLRKCFKTYEQALEDALKYALEKLV